MGQGQPKSWGEWTTQDKEAFIKLLSTNTDFQESVKVTVVTDKTFRDNLTKAINDDTTFREQLSIVLKDNIDLKTSIANALKNDKTFKTTIKGDIGAKGAKGDRGAAGPPGPPGPPGGITLKQVNEEIKKNSMWCADGSVCKIPKNFRLEKNFSMHSNNTFQIDEPNIPGGRVNINKDGIAFGKPVSLKSGVSISQRLCFTGSNTCIGKNPKSQAIGIFTNNFYTKDL